MKRERIACFRQSTDFEESLMSVLIEEERSSKDQFIDQLTLTSFGRQRTTPMLSATTGVYEARDSSLSARQTR